MSAEVEGSEVEFAGRHVRAGKGHLWARGRMGWGPRNQRSHCVKGELNPLFLRGLGKWWIRCAAIRGPGPQQHGRGACVKGRGALLGTCRAGRGELWDLSRQESRQEENGLKVYPSPTTL